jgi:hypothetical protein
MTEISFVEHEKAFGRGIMQVYTIWIIKIQFQQAQGVVTACGLPDHVGKIGSAQSMPVDGIGIYDFSLLVQYLVTMGIYVTWVPFNGRK